MLILSKDNITEYLKTWIPELDISGPMLISEIGEGTEEEDGDGFLNYVFRVSDGKYHLVVKQGRSQGRRVDFPLSKERNRLEYESLKIRKAIVPEYVPDIYFYDDENRVFAMEDVSYLKIARFQLNRSVMFPKLAAQAAEYLAKTHFYTSEYYLDTKLYRELTTHFMNHEMRSIFDDMGSISRQADEDSEGDLDPQYASLIEDIVFDPAVIRERLSLRERYIKQGETFIHGDFHTSNIFVNEDEMKVIDMEYTFCGPIGYDAGYLANNFLSQYICAFFRPFNKEEEREEFQKYCLDSIRILFDEYFHQFFLCWRENAKPIYRKMEEYPQFLKEEWLKDMIGFCANANLSRCSGAIGFPEYDAIYEPLERKHAVCMSLIIDKILLLNCRKYVNIQECIRDVQENAKAYMEKISIMK